MRDKMFIMWFSSPLRLAYLQVVEEATKAWVSRTLSSSPIKSTSLLIREFLLDVGVITNVMEHPQELGASTSDS